MLTRFSSYLALAGRIWCAPGNQGRKLAALSRSVGWLLNKKLGRRPWTLKVFGKLLFRCHPESIIALHVVQRSEWFDAEVSRFMEHYLKPGDTFVDIGANVGLYTLACSQWVGPQGKVIAVEPSPVNLARLRENLALNGNPSNVTVHPCALSEQAGTLRFDDADVQAHALSNRTEILGRVIEVPAVRFDAIDPGTEMALMKIDVEGFELHVLKGALRAIESGRVPVILFEMNRAIEDYGLRAQDIFDFLRAHSYQIGQYSPEDRSLNLSGSPEGELTAFTERGRELMVQRIQELKID